MKKFISIFLGILLMLYCLYWQLPFTKIVYEDKLPANRSLLLLPLDSRPVCTELVQELGQLGSLNVILPPKQLLDNYKKPADKEKLLLWLKDNLKKQDEAIISADLLLHGGLLHSRQDFTNPMEQKQLLAALQQITNDAPNLHASVFSVIPRLLVSDEMLPDAWYQFHLMKYSQLFDMVEISNDPFMTKELYNYIDQIPPITLIKYRSLYANNEDFHKQLLLLANKQLEIFIGQDDGSPFGLPHRSARHAQAFIKSNDLESYATVTYGADELASLLLARSYLHNYPSQWTPKVYLQYADSSVEFYHMPYMTDSVGATLRNQLKMVGAAEAASPEEADIVLYVNCGHNKYKPADKQVQELTQLINSGKHIALVDSAANFNTDELLVPLLLDQGAPINRLSAYAGWNTFGNSSGTAIAQAIIFAGQSKTLQKKQLPALYSANLRFNVERLLDDYYYQKLLHPTLKHELYVMGHTHNDLTQEGMDYCNERVQIFSSLQAEILLHSNLGRTPFYSQNGTDYYLRNIYVGANLPWNRIFEVRLDVFTEIGTKTH